MAQNSFPKKVCVLDLETSKLVRGEPEKTPLAFVGTLIYELRGGRYQAGPHRCFFPDELKGLEQLLKSFEGIVLGHNILNFDYKVLGARISLEGVVGKTVDTLAFLYEKRSTEPLFAGGTSRLLEGLSLDNLTQKNLGRGKVISGRSIPKLWREGRREEVIAYNKEDLVLTYSLWWWMVEGRTVLIREREKFDMRTVVGDRVYEPGRVEIFEEDRPRLTGQRPLFNTRVVMITGGPLLEEPPPDADDEPNYWYRGALARHYLREDEVMISDPRMGFFGENFEAGPYPADWFTFSVWREGPDFPARSAPGDDAIGIEDVL